MKYDTCICCGNNDKNDYLIFNYSKICSMNYPEILDNSNILYCKQCSFSFCENQFDDDYLNLYYSKYYNGKSIKSDSHSNNFFIRNLFYDQRSISQITFLNQFLNLNNIKILDIGSGSAIFFLQLNRVGLQNVEKYIIEPQIKNKEWYKSNKIEVIDFDLFNEIPKEHLNQFDLIFMSHSLEHFNSSSINILIQNIKKLLNKEGKVFIEVPNADLKEYIFANENMQPHLSFFTKQSIKKFFLKNNFSIIYSETFGFSQKNKKTDNQHIDTNKFFTNKDGIKIHKNANDHFKLITKQRLFFNKFLYYISLFISKKFIIFLKDFYFIFLKKKNLSFKDREFLYNPNDGEFLRIIAKLNE